MSENWANYVKKHASADMNSVIARKLAISPSTITRWINGSVHPEPKQAAEFARAYGRHPFEGLIAAEYLTAEDLQGEVSINTAVSLDSYSTDALMKEVTERLDVIGDYAGWIRSIVNGDESPARLGVSTLRYVDPTRPPVDVRGEDFLDVLEAHVEQGADVAGDNVFQIRPNVRGVPETELLEVSGETKVDHDKDNDDY